MKGINLKHFGRCRSPNQRKKSLANKVSLSVITSPNYRTTEKIYHEQVLPDNKCFRFGAPVERLSSIHMKNNQEQNEERKKHEEK